DGARVINSVSATHNHPAGFGKNLPGESQAWSPGVRSIPVNAETVVNLRHADWKLGTCIVGRYDPAFERTGERWITISPVDIEIRADAEFVVRMAQPFVSHSRVEREIW